MKITLNLATRPYADQGPAIKQLRIGMGVLAGVLILLGFGLAHFHHSAAQMKAQEDSTDRSIAQIRSEEHGYQLQMQQPPNARVLTQAGFLNDLFDEKSFSWTAAMEDLERVLPQGVQVTAIEPIRAKDGRLTLRLRVAGARERSVQMVRNMERSARFANPRISGENAESNNNGPAVQNVNEPVRVSFDLLAEYNPASVDQRRQEIASQKVADRKHPRPASPAVPRRGAAAAVPTRVPPQYVPPQYVSPAQPPDVPPAQMSNRPRLAPRTNQPPDGPPTGYDPSGLHNHSQNSTPPPNYPTSGDPQVEPQ